MVQKMSVRVFLDRLNYAKCCVHWETNESFLSYVEHLS